MKKKSITIYYQVAYLSVMEKKKTLNRHWKVSFRFLQASEVHFYCTKSLTYL